MRLKRLFTVVLAVLALAVVPAGAVDHNNIDAGRPLSFDDAESIAFRERALEGGVGIALPKNRPAGLELEAEYLYGFARNSHVLIGFHPSIGGRTHSDDTGFDVGDVTLGMFHNFNREYNGTPAFALRGDLFLPTGRDSEGLGVRLRGIMSRHAGQYGRLHVNVDLNATSDPARGERQFHPGLTLGYSRPLGYPTRFDTTGVAELSVQSGSESGTGPVIGAGIGVRKQVGVRSVVDLGLRSDLIGIDAAPRDRLRLIAGYSVGY
jgi:hypothetical protein